MFDCGIYYVEEDVEDALDLRLEFEGLMELEAEHGRHRGPDGEWEVLVA